MISFVGRQLDASTAAERHQTVATAEGRGLRLTVSENLTHGLTGLFPKGPEARKTIAQRVSAGTVLSCMPKPQRGVRVPYNESYAPMALTAVAHRFPSLAAGATLFRASGPLGNSP